MVVRNAEKNYRGPGVFFETWMGIDMPSNSFSSHSGALSHTAFCYFLFLLLLFVPLHTPFLVQIFRREREYNEDGDCTIENHARRTRSNIFDAPFSNLSSGEARSPLIWRETLGYSYTKCCDSKLNYLRDCLFSFPFLCIFIINEYW